MKILLTNDDGIYAPGLAALYHELKHLGEVQVVAPESEQSAVGHAITLMTPLRVKEVSLNCGVEGFAVSGFPADCVKIAIAELLPSPPDLVVSGINLGPNVGINVLYSGTVSAATEAGILAGNPDPLDFGPGQVGQVDVETDSIVPAAPAPDLIQQFQG